MLARIAKYGRLNDRQELRFHPPFQFSEDAVGVLWVTLLHIELKDLVEGFRIFEFP